MTNCAKLPFLDFFSRHFWHADICKWAAGYVHLVVSEWMKHSAPLGYGCSDNVVVFRFRKNGAKICNSFHCNMLCLNCGPFSPWTICTMIVPFVP